MDNFELKVLTNLADTLYEKMPYIFCIKTRTEYHRVNKIFEKLNTEHGKEYQYRNLINLIDGALQSFEKESKYAEQLSSKINGIEKPTQILRYLMYKYKLNTYGFKNEVGSNTMVSHILRGNRQLSAKAVLRLSEKFGIPIEDFYSDARDALYYNIPQEPSYSDVVDEVKSLSKQLKEITDKLQNFAD